ncbi:tyrosine-protein kinase ZAP-70-like isoform X2 [Watersipora subatra]|uniref:tyrosine-protein kinase ZAP-70-like isoform X2 n=1 Tax=Watersipora subatra TaxID=2589382 RepID=UPI00355BE08F
MSGTLTAKPVGAQSYFYGRITRDESEKILRERGCQDGLFLLRESTKRMGDYVLSLCAHNNIHHYSMEMQVDGKVMIENGKRFPGPVELLEYHRTHRDGLLTYPTNPCSRSPNESYVVFRGVSSAELDAILLDKARELGIKGNRNELLTDDMRQRLINEVKGTLHTSQPWFHGNITREDAERAFAKCGHEDGKYLLRYQKDKGEYRLTLSFEAEAKHYIVSFKNRMYHIEQGPNFESLIEMVDHYHNKADGLLCPLKLPCIRPGYQPPFRQLQGQQYNSSNRGASATVSTTRSNEPRGSKGNIQPHKFNKVKEQHNGFLPATPPRPAKSFASGQPSVPLEINDETQKIYDSVPTTEASFNLSLKDLELKDKLGAGCFGSVLKGVYKRGGQNIPVAVKTLKLDDAAGKEEIMKEARIMAALKNRNVVRLIGVCHADTIMLVLELAPLGPLNKFLKEDPNLPMIKITNLMHQVAVGMRYLESQKFVHRDLAARNVLLVNNSFAKISDFGMSKALGMDGEYYKASAAGKWPLKWYAPECIYYFKFDSKSDVWSYGVTLWEATSRGGKPYQKLKGAEIIRMIDEGKRLDKPQECPADVYKVMLDCWQYEKDDRPSFAQLVETMKKFRS